MALREFHYRWVWELQAAPDALWPLIADTNRFNQDTQLPAVRRQAEPERPATDPRQKLAFRVLGMPVEWVEQPFEWVRPFRFGVMRRYHRGPVAHMRVDVELQPRESGGTRLVYQVWAAPRSMLGWIAIPIQIGLISARRFDAVIREYDRAAVERRVPTLAHASLDAASQTRLMGLRTRLLGDGINPNLLDRLIGLIRGADELTVARLRPYALADHWGKHRRTVLEAFLLATRAGLLDFRWELLCPLCRGAQHSVNALQEIDASVHCAACHIDFTANFDRLIELTFRPNPAIRPVEVHEFCVGGPQVTPHIVAQQLLPAGTERQLRLLLEEGRYRLRAKGTAGGQMLVVTKEGAASGELKIDDAGWPNDERRLAPVSQAVLQNATSRELLFILERMAWTDQAATGADVTALQMFRDLFAHEALRPGERISVGSLTVVFTDLCQSTRLYREIGDAPAFGCVMSHFDVLRTAVSAEGGAIVKTMGDAIMAVFRTSAPAVRAALAAQRDLANPVDHNRPLQLKAGIHAGPCIAVTLNERLDYFGSTVNATARLASLSTGADVVLSAAVRHDPEVAGLMAASSGAIAAEQENVVLRGFDPQRFELWRARQLVAPPG